MSQEIFTPFTRETATVELSGARPRYRKQIMKLEQIRYRDKTGERLIDFDRSYLEDLVRAYQNRAYDQVAFQLADAANGHNNDPERFRGELVGVELTADGLDGIFEPTPDGERLIQANPKLGVSCRIIENLEHSDGRSYPRAIQHVLGTVNPQLTGMRPWERVDLSRTGITQTLDLSTGTSQEDLKMTETATEGKVTVELSQTQAARLAELLDDMDAAKDLAKLVDLSGPDDEGDEQEQEESGDDEADRDERESTTDLSRPDSDAMQLLLSRVDTAEQRSLELSAQLRQQQIGHEIDRLREQGLAPAIIEAAKPLLAVPAGAVELSNPDGTRTDPAEVVRDVLRTVLELTQSGLAVVDLDLEAGYVTGQDPAQARRDAMVADWEKSYS